MPKFEGANWHKVNVATKAIEQFFFCGNTNAEDVSEFVEGGIKDMVRYALVIGNSRILEHSDPDM